MVVVQRLTKGVEGQKGERSKTIILLRASTIAKQGPQGRAKRSAQRFVGGATPTIYLRTNERNKIKILLRSITVYVIIKESKLYLEVL